MRWVYVNRSVLSRWSNVGWNIYTMRFVKGNDDEGTISGNVTSGRKLVVESLARLLNGNVT